MTSERKSFERWLQDKWPSLDIDFVRSGGTYENGVIRSQWSAWQARARIAAERERELMDALEEITNWCAKRGGDQDEILPPEHQFMHVRHAMHELSKAKRDSGDPQGNEAAVDKLPSHHDDPVIDFFEYTLASEKLLPLICGQPNNTKGGFERGKALARHHAASHARDVILEMSELHGGKWKSLAEDWGLFA